MSERIHTTAAAGFARAGADYERGRPGYPPAAVSHLARSVGVEPGARVLDLAAGTGKLTRALANSGAELIAVEPVAEMREQFERSLPGVRVLVGTAEHIPLPDSELDAVVVAQAFHWFDARAAAAEIHRVLRPGGGLGVIWNAWDESKVPWVARVQALVHEHIGSAPQHATSHWPQELEATGLFTPLHQETFAHVVTGDLDNLLARVASVSYISALPDNSRAQVLDSIAEIVAHDPETAGRDQIAMPYTTHVVACHRLAQRRL
ncbi:MAG: class I SAM-dependent methyltransferase [Solirubrobacteraceae bacterium]